MECQLENICIHYTQLGEGQPFLMLHGGVGDHQIWVRMLEPLFAHRTGWQRIYLDLPGHGATPGPAWMTDENQLLDVLLQFIDRVMPGERFALAGFSWGGYLARGILHRRLSDVAGLLLIAPTIQRESPTLPVRQVLIRDEMALAGLDEGLKAVVEGVAVVQDAATLDRIGALQAEFRTAHQDDPDFAARMRRGFDFAIDHLPQVFERPTLFLLGRQDHLVGYRDAWQIIENFPRATFAVLDQAGHMLTVEQADLCQALMREWLERVVQSLRA